MPEDGCVAKASLQGEGSTVGQRARLSACIQWWQSSEDNTQRDNTQRGNTQRDNTLRSGVWGRVIRGLGDTG